MKKLMEKIILWPAYFDVSLTRLEGRRTAKSTAVVNPNVEEISDAAMSLGLEPELHKPLRYPRFWWKSGGYIIVKKTGPKQRLLNIVALRLVEHRNRTMKKT